MGKPELLITPTCLADIDLLADAGADAFLIGEQQYGLRLAGQFSRSQVRQVVKKAHQRHKKVYVAMNAIFHNEKIAELEDYVKFLSELEVDAIVFGDPAVLMTVKEQAPNLKLHWNPEQTATNWYTCNYWGRKGATRAVLARELNGEAIIEIKENAEVEIQVQVHGMTCMFQSKRTLLSNYFEYQGQQLKLLKDQRTEMMYLYDEERDSKYPIFEDVNGTHIMSPNDICLIEDLEDLIASGIDSFKIDGIFKSSEYLAMITKIYRTAIDLCKADPHKYEEQKFDLYKRIAAIQPNNRPLDLGFFFKETIY